MKLNKRALRKIRRAKKDTAVASINLVSMIDIFTIMIIYLLVNTAAVQIAGAEQVSLPTSIALDPPRETVSIIVSLDDVLVDGEPVMKTADVAQASAPLPALRDKLLQASPLTERQQQDASAESGDVNILADKGIEYAVLKKVMATCADDSVRFKKISLGVTPAGS